jgi:hypothetical protein
LSDESFIVSPTYKEEEGKVAVVSDWRRGENLHGIVEFFSMDALSALAHKNFEFWVYGISSSVALEAIKAIPNLAKYKFYDGGVFGSYNDIPTKYFLVPIYQGAGIKLKTLEMFSNGRFVLGTPGAFIGLPRSLIKQYSSVVFRPSQIALVCKLSPQEIQNSFQRTDAKLFIPMGDILKGWGS